MKPIKTLEGICRILKAEGFKKYAKDYGSSRVCITKSAIDAINTLESYRDDEALIDHFNEYRNTIVTEYSTVSTPFYKTEAFKDQNQKEIKEFGYIASM